MAVLHLHPKHQRLVAHSGCLQLPLTTAAARRWTVSHLHPETPAPRGALQVMLGHLRAGQRDLHLLAGRRHAPVAGFGQRGTALACPLPGNARPSRPGRCSRPGATLAAPAARRACASASRAPAWLLAACGPAGHPPTAASPSCRCYGRPASPGAPPCAAGPRLPLPARRSSAPARRSADPGRRKPRSPGQAVADRSQATIIRAGPQ